ncbi:K(+)-transporting ATPase subunit F [Streptomyces sp. NPDC089919]
MSTEKVVGIIIAAGLVGYLLRAWSRPEGH